MKPTTICESCVRTGNIRFIFTLTSFSLFFVLCGTVNLLNASDAQPAPSDSVAELVNAVNELTIRIANLEARLVQYERVESILKPPLPREQFAGMHLAKENAWRKYRWTDPAQWAQIKKGISQSEVIDALGNPPRWVESMKPSVDKVYFYEIGGRFKRSKLKGQVSFKKGVVVNFQKPDFSNFHSTPEGFQGH